MESGLRVRLRSQTCCQTVRRAEGEPAGPGPERGSPARGRETGHRVPGSLRLGNDVVGNRMGVPSTN